MGGKRSAQEIEEYRPAQDTASKYSALQQAIVQWALRFNEPFTIEDLHAMPVYLESDREGRIGPAMRALVLERAFFQAGTAIGNYPKNHPNAGREYDLVYYALNPQFVYDHIISTSITMLRVRLTCLHEYIK